MKKGNKVELVPGNAEEFIAILKGRFEKNRKRHPGLVWDEVQTKLKSSEESKKLVSLYEMEKSGGEPDVMGYDSKTGEFLFCDFSAESPSGRRSLCYDRDGLESRKEFKPGNSAMDLAAEMGIDMLTEEQYRSLQKLGTFDQKTSSWLKTPDAIRKLGGAIFGDYRYGQVFVYHNGASSYYAARGFRGILRI